MDLMTFLCRVETSFFDHIDRKAVWKKEEVKEKFSDAITDVLILTYGRVVKDAGEMEV
ncbi:MAG: hypothetical protein QMD92_00075 [bacterium]|nr:hypothetical protein [bacterium]